MCLPGCKSEGYLQDISRISYTSDSGTILPELQWHEEIVITRGQVSLSRNGRTPDTQINAGSWEFPVDEAKVAALFDQLKTVDVSAIRRIEPEVQPDGGDSESFTILYARNKKLVLDYGQGATYTNDAFVVESIRAFLRSLTLPPQAAARY
jgi:hypothetical protein